MTTAERERESVGANGAADPPPPSTKQKLRHPGRILLAVTAGALVVYYLALLLVGNVGQSTVVPIAKSGLPPASEAVTVQTRAVQADPSTRTLQLTMRPTADGTPYAGEIAGDLKRPLRMQVFSAGRAPVSFSFPADSTLDEVATSVALGEGGTVFPFDRPQADLRLLLQDERTGAAIPTNLELENNTKTWVISSSAQSARAGAVAMRINTRRDGLSVALVVFQLLAILLTTMIAVSVIGSALVRQGSSSPRSSGSARPSWRSRRCAAPCRGCHRSAPPRTSSSSSRAWPSSRWRWWPLR